MAPVPVVCIFTRSVPEELADLAAQIDTSLTTYSDDKLAAFLVLLTDDPDAHVQPLKTVAEQQQLQQLPLTIYPQQAGPRGYDIAEDAETTVMMWHAGKITATHTFSDARPDSSGVEAVMTSLEDLVR